MIAIIMLVCFSHPLNWVPGVTLEMHIMAIQSAAQSVATASKVSLTFSQVSSRAPLQSNPVAVGMKRPVKATLLPLLAQSGHDIPLEHVTWTARDISWLEHA